MELSGGQQEKDSVVSSDLCLKMKLQVEIRPVPSNSFPQPFPEVRVPTCLAAFTIYQLHGAFHWL